jgi:hypothetical protein
VQATVLAHWKPAVVYDFIFRERPDAVLLVLTALQQVAHVNTMAMGWLRPHVARLGLDPIVIVNDAHGRNPKFPTFSAERVKKDHGVPWPVRETMIGNWDNGKLRWQEGANDTWQLLV